MMKAQEGNTRIAAREKKYEKKSDVKNFQTKEGDRTIFVLISFFRLSLKQRLFCIHAFIEGALGNYP